jgi:hypothetical protein
VFVRAHIELAGPPAMLPTASDRWWPAPSAAGPPRTVRIRRRVEVVVIARTSDSAGGSLREEVRLGHIAVCQATVMTT